MTGSRRALLAGMALATGALCFGPESPLGPTSASGQAMGIDLGTDCDLESFREIDSREAVPGSGRRITRVSRPVMICPNDVRLQADSAVIYEETGRNEMIGRVRFRSPDRELDSDLADWFEVDSRLFARGNVLFRDRERGTEIRGDTLNYLEERPGRPEDQLTVWGTRPSALLRPRADAGVPTPDAFRVTADRLRFQGDRFFWGDGNAEVERDDLQARADSMAYDQEQGQLILLRDAWMEREGVTTTGQQINLAIQNDVLESLRAQGEARLETDDYDLTGEDIQVELAEEQEVRSITSDGGEGVQARLTSAEIDFRGNRIEIPEPDGDSRTIRAVGQARAEAMGTEAPPIRVSDDWTIEQDWIEGNEVEASFLRRTADPEVDDATGVPDDDPPADDIVAGPEETGSSEGLSDEWILQELVATGGAATLYRQPPDPNEIDGEEGADPPQQAGEDPDQEGEEPPTSDERPAWSVAYVKADRIVIRFSGGDVEELIAEGNVDGIRSEPIRAPRTTPAADPAEEMQ